MRTRASMTDHPRRIAIVHDWLTGMRGGEKCVEAMCEIFPDATLFTLLHVPGSLSPTIERMPIRTSFVQRLPRAASHYRHYLPLFPAAIRRLDLRGFDCVISSHHCVAKGVRSPPGALHVCYCYTPMRYLWDMYDEYFGRGRAGAATRAAMAVLRPALQRFDLRTAAGPRHFVAISEHVRGRIRQIYGRDADVIYPPVDMAMFPLNLRDGDYHLVVSALVPYKRVDLAITAFNRMRRRLVIVGRGPDLERLRRMAGPTIEFAGWRSDEELREYYAGCRALVFPGEEDFGIVPLEAMATGKPVVALGRGGALETVSDGRTGVLFGEQTPEALIEAVARCEASTFDPEALRAAAARFERGEFKRRFEEYLLRRWGEFAAAGGGSDRS